MANSTATAEARTNSRETFIGRETFIDSLPGRLYARRAGAIYFRAYYPTGQGGRLALGTIEPEYRV